MLSSMSIAQGVSAKDLQRDSFEQCLGAVAMVLCYGAKALLLAACRVCTLGCSQCSVPVLLPFAPISGGPSWALALQATEEMYSAFTEGFTGRWADAVRSGTAGDLCPADIFGPDAPSGTEALQVMLPAHIGAL